MESKGRFVFVAHMLPGGGFKVFFWLVTCFNGMIRSDNTVDGPEIRQTTRDGAKTM